MNEKFIQTAARDRMKRFQDKISDLDTRSTLPKREKELRIKEAREGINRMDSIIKKRSNAGRPRTRTGGDTSRLSMLSNASTLPPFTTQKP